MNRILLLLSLLPTIPLAASVEAQCDTKESIFTQMFKTHQETYPEFVSVNELHGSKTHIAIFSNPSTGNWTLVEFDDEKACVIGFGKRSVS